MLQDILDIVQHFGTMLHEFGPYVFGLVAMLLIIIGLLSIVLLGIRFMANITDNFLNKFTSRLDEIQNEVNRLQGRQSDMTNRSSMPKESLIQVYLRLNTALKHDCRDILERIKADRIAIYLFHNGTHAINGVPFLKTSCLCEYTRFRSAAYQLIKDHKDIPINLLGDLITDLVHKQEFIVYKKDIGLVDDIISRLLLNDKEKTCVFTSIYEPEDGEILGFITAEYDDIDIFDKEVEENNMTELRELSKRSSAILQISKLVRQSEKN